VISIRALAAADAFAYWAPNAMKLNAKSYDELSMLLQLNPSGSD
jgi:hypothetical protein